MSSSKNSHKPCAFRFHPSALAIGAGIGTSIGVALHNVAVGTAIGIGMAFVFNAARRNKNP